LNPGCVVPFSFLDYCFKDTILLETALTHRSVGKNNYERLEFLGDSVLGLVITDALFNAYPNESEGTLTRLRSYLVKKESLSRLARELNLGEQIKLGAGEMKSGGWRRDSILANTLEALIGAVYLDSNFLTCKDVVLSIYKNELNSLDVEKVGKDPKTLLQELLQSKNMPLPIYTIVDEFGEAHKKTFIVSCQVEGLSQSIEASGKSKRVAEQSAASKVLDIIENTN
jgi:ribonuclease III